jgi:ribosomal protein L37AE/L43A
MMTLGVILILIAFVAFIVGTMMKEHGRRLQESGNQLHAVAKQIGEARRKLQAAIQQNQNLVECWVCPDCHQLNDLNNKLGSFECQNCHHEKKGDEAVTTVALVDYWEQSRFGAEAERRRRKNEKEKKKHAEEIEEQRQIDEKIRKLLDPDDE